MHVYCLLSLVRKFGRLLCVLDHPIASACFVELGKNESAKVHFRDALNQKSLPTDCRHARNWRLSSNARSVARYHRQHSSPEFRNVTHSRHIMCFKQTVVQYMVFERTVVKLSVRATEQQPSVMTKRLSLHRSTVNRLLARIKE